MRLETTFRLSVYLTLSMASLCLGSAADTLLPGMFYFSVGIATLVMFGFFLEERWALSNWASNGLALLISLGSGVWVYRNLAMPVYEWVPTAPFPAVLLPFGAPVLMLLSLAKVFRPKRLADFWWIHLIGLMEIALGGVMAVEISFAGFLFLYLACGLWSLLLLYQYQESVRAEHSGAAPSAAANRKATPPYHVFGLGFAGRQAVVATVLGVALFLLTPRIGTPQWQLGTTFSPRVQMETGFASQVDLNRTGRLQVNTKPAFEIYVEDARGNPKLDLDPEQRFRGATLDTYSLGQWKARTPNSPPGGGNQAPYWVELGASRGQSLGAPDECFITFELNVADAGGLFLADPVQVLPDRRAPPVVGLSQTSAKPYFHYLDRCLLSYRGNFPRPYRYQQIFRPAKADGPTPADAPRENYVRNLLQQPVEGIREYTATVLRDLVAERKFPADTLQRERDPVAAQISSLPPERRDLIARALNDYLATSGQFTYSLDRERVDRSLDPTEDFLRNAKQGHCEHYATALVLMLRSAGIPARLISGFRGLESQQDASERMGWYTIRQSHAHTWAEALIGQKTEAGKYQYFWIPLDPTPSEESVAQAGTSSFFNWLSDTQNLGYGLWRSLIIDSSTESVRATMLTMVNQFFPETPANLLPDLVNGRATSSGGWLAALVVVGLGILRLVAVRRRRARLEPPQSVSNSPAPPPPVDFYVRWLAVVAKHLQLAPAPTQTPREFGEQVHQVLRQPGGAGALAEVPRLLVNMYYQVRYGGQTLGPSEVGAAHEQVRDVEAAIAPVSPA